MTNSLNLARWHLAHTHVCDCFSFGGIGMWCLVCWWLRVQNPGRYLNIIVVVVACSCPSSSPAAIARLFRRLPCYPCPCCARIIKTLPRCCSCLAAAAATTPGSLVLVLGVEGGDRLKVHRNRVHDARVADGRGCGRTALRQIGAGEQSQNTTAGQRVVGVAGLHVVAELGDLQEVEVVAICLAGDLNARLADCSMKCAHERKTYPVCAASSA